MTAFGFDVKGCIGVRILGYTLVANPTGERTDISACELAADYEDGTVVHLTVPLEMNLAAFLEFIRALNRDLRRRA